jgi:hypothetical protein
MCSRYGDPARDFFPSRFQNPCHSRLHGSTVALLNSAKSMVVIRSPESRWGALLPGNPEIEIRGAGMEASLGSVGLRFELGDEIYFNNGEHNNLRVTFGPILRF